MQPHQDHCLKNIFYPLVARIKDHVNKNIVMRINIHAVNLCIKQFTNILEGMVVKLLSAQNDTWMKLLYKWNQMAIIEKAMSNIVTHQSLSVTYVQ